MFYCIVSYIVPFNYFLMNDRVKSVRLRRAISLGIAALIVVAVIIAAGFGLYFGLVLNANNNVNPGGTGISSTQTTTKSSSSVAYPTTYSTSSSGGSLTRYSLQIPQLVFGVNHGDVIQNETLLLPSDTFIWETFVLNSTTTVSGINFEIIVPQSSLGSGNISAAYYLNGDMVSQNTFSLVGQVPTAVLNGNQPPTITTQEFSLVVNQVFKSESNVTVALIAQSPVSLELANGTGNSLLLQNVTSFPEVLPLQANSNESLFFAWGSYG